MSEPLHTPKLMPQFTIEARPRSVPTELACLRDDAIVSFSSAICGWQSSGIMTANALRGQIEAAIARQAEGHFTLTEAAQVIADAQGGRPELHLDQMLDAWKADLLSIHRGGSRYLRKSGETICNFDDTVTVADLDDWLQAQTGRGFPAVVDAGANVTVARSGGAVSRFGAQERAILSHLSAQGLDPEKLPRNKSGKPGVKAATKKALQGTPDFIGAKVFEKAWDRLRANKEIMDAK
jgi:hypothetical protein